MKFLVDGVFFQYYNTGIARVWRSILTEWSKTDFGKYIVLLDRGGTAPQIPGIETCLISPHNYADLLGDRYLLQQVSDRYGAAGFISTYYSRPESTPTLFLAHDFIPERFGADLSHPMWVEKRDSLMAAATTIVVSQQTAVDLETYYPGTYPVVLAYNGVDSEVFYPRIDKIADFKRRYGLHRPYLLLSGAGEGYKNGILFFQALSELSTNSAFDIVLTGTYLVPDIYRDYLNGNSIIPLMLNDDDLATAYTAATALVYPSLFEGFGLPVLEAMACGCPVIGLDSNLVLKEIAGEDGMLYSPHSPVALSELLAQVQLNSVRDPLIAEGLSRSGQFTWAKMAKTIAAELVALSLPRTPEADLVLWCAPNWDYDPESLFEALSTLFVSWSKYPSKVDYGFLFYIGDRDVSVIQQFVADVLLTLALDFDFDTSLLDIVYCPTLNDLQWEVLKPSIWGRVDFPYIDDDYSSFDTLIKF